MTYNTQRLIHEFLKQGGYSLSIDAEQLDREFDLVAAAPDLLAALEELLESQRGDWPLRQAEAKQQARAAIAKAKGQ